MGKKRLTKLVLASFLAFSLTATSWGGAFANAALAATPEETPAVVSSDSSSKAVVGGLIALGLLAILAKGGSKSSSGSSAGKTTTPPATNQTPSPTPAPVPSTPSGLSAAEQQALTLLNADRAANGLPALKANLKLTGLAESYAQDMINRGFFSHYNPEGQSPFDRMNKAGIKYGYAGENLAINTSVPSAEQAFMNSPGHRANILNANYAQVGLGVRTSSNGSVYVVQEFTD